MTLVGVALLPSADSLDSLVQFSEHWRQDLGDLRLGRTQAIPHVSLHQIPVASVELFVRALSQFSGVVVGRSEFGSLYYQPVGWIFAMIQREVWMLDLQASVVAALDGLLDRSRMKQLDELDGYSDDERASYVRHGYRYVGEPFKPHFTIGRTDSARLDISAGCSADYARRFEGRPVEFNRIVGYRAGAHGSLAEVLVEVGI